MTTPALHSIEPSRVDGEHQDQDAKSNAALPVTSLSPSQRPALNPRCVSVDLEVGIKDAKIHRFAGVRGDTDASYVYQKGDLLAALAKLDEVADGASFLLGHNIIAFDRPHLAAVKPDLRLLSLPTIDTLCLNPLAFPRNPYHRLVKHYQDGKLQRGQLNNPELDARLTIEVFRDQLVAFKELAQEDPDLVTAWHWLTTSDNTVSGLNAFFLTVRRAARPTDEEAHIAIGRRIRGQSCETSACEILAKAKTHGWPLAYALAWLSVAGGNSVMPPWVRHQYPEASDIVRRLRDTACSALDCTWCRERHDARKELKRWFGFPEFRPQPADASGRPLQEVIVEATMGRRHVLGILPTGTGKSLCYQIPALSRFDKTGALTVVISPLVALMADQVAGLEARGIGVCAAINGLLSLPERADVLDRVRLGDVGILIVAPEQLRSKAVRKVLAQREIGMWVLDEAHCISKWGHDFRPDYRYVGRFIRESAKVDVAAPVLCLTATAKPDVVADMLEHFRTKVGIELTVFDGGASRDNLDFAVVPTTPADKFPHLHQILQSELPEDMPGGAIIYCATRKQTEEIAKYLQEKGLAADFFHAGLPPETKKDVQRRFVEGELRVITATNAFGMGIDKPDVRLVIHADMPGSLENYLQEAGRAGRDRAPARCIALYTAEDVERQFSMSARSRLTQKEIQAVLKSLRALERKKQATGEVIATAGEILAEDAEGDFERDSATDDTRVRTAISWLEEAALLTRDENHVQVFPSSLRIATMDEARDKLKKQALFDDYRRQLLAIIYAMLSAEADEGISTDELMGIAGLSADKLRTALYDLERLGIASNDTGLTTFVHSGVNRSSQKRLEEAIALENGLIDLMREVAPDLQKGETSLLQLRHTTQALKDHGHAGALPDKISRLVNSIASDGRNEDGGLGSLRLRRLDAENIQVTLQRDWTHLARTADLRRQAAALVLQHLISVLPSGARGTDLLAETTLGALHAALKTDVVLVSQVKDSAKLLDRALLWLHEQDIIRLNKGLAVFRPAMTIRLGSERRGFIKADFAPLKMHYDEQVVQIHVMAEYAQRGLQQMNDALRLANDYFKLDKEEFLRRWLPLKQKELEQQTLPASYAAIVDSLNHPVQQRIVADDREQTNVLVLAGPGSGKTRVLVHRIAYLVRVRRENPRGILALAYNRHAAVEIRRRLASLIGDDAKGVVVMTCHAFAMRLTGTSFRKHAAKDEQAFKSVMREAVALLKGEGAAIDEADALRDRLLASFRWILVDEYQDIGPDQYELIAALAGRARSEEDGRLSLFAVGDDDQNIYAFDGASVEFIRRFEDDYAAKPVFLVENYRSTGNIIAASNQVIAPALNRMKADHPITVNHRRGSEDAGGAWAKLDPVGRGQVLIVEAGKDDLSQAEAVMAEMRRLFELSPERDWSRMAIIAREWKTLDPVRAYCEQHGIPVQMADEDTAHCWQLRETRALVAWLRGRPGTIVTIDEIQSWLMGQPTNRWWGLLLEAAEHYAAETTHAEVLVDHFNEWLAEWGQEVRRRQNGLLLLTAHRAKGLEFDHVAVLDGNWRRSGPSEDGDAPRRLYYVAMTRARSTLILARLDGRQGFCEELLTNPAVMIRRPPRPLLPQQALRRRYLRLPLKHVDLGYAGRRHEQDPLHAAIASLSADSPVTLEQNAEQWEIMDDKRRVVGRLARSFRIPDGMRFLSGKVNSVIVRRCKDSDPTFQASLRCEQWEVILPELVFEPIIRPDALR